MTVEQGVIQQFGGGPLFLELRQSQSVLPRTGFLLSGGINRCRVTIRGRLRRRGRHRGDEPVLLAAAIFEDGGQLGRVWQLHSYDWLDLRDIKNIEITLIPL